MEAGHLRENPQTPQQQENSSNHLTLQKADGLSLSSKQSSHQTKRNNKKLTSTGLKQQQKTKSSTKQLAPTDPILGPENSQNWLRWKAFPQYLFVFSFIYIYTYIYMIYILSKSIECSQLDRLHPCREVEPRWDWERGKEPWLDMGGMAGFFKRYLLDLGRKLWLDRGWILWYILVGGLEHAFSFLYIRNFIIPTD